MNEFVQRQAEKVMGCLSGFDRLWFRGTLRLLTHVSGMLAYLRYGRGGNVLLKDFGVWSQGITARVKAAGRQAMRATGEPIYLTRPSQSKEDIAREIARQRGIKRGPVCLLEAVEPCQTFEVHKDKEKHWLELQSKTRKCLHQYAYWLDEEVGFCHVRVQTWLPLDVRISMNGREWLCRSLAREKIPFVRQENCLKRVGDEGRAQELLLAQRQTHWPSLLGRVVARSNPGLREVLWLDGQPLDRYWSLEQSEGATDVLFKRAADLDALYPFLTRQAMLGLGSQDVMRFLGARVCVDGRIPAWFRKEVASDLKVRPEGLRVKHRVGNNSVKMYNKQARVLRTETTIHDPQGLKAYRGTEADPENKKWRPCRKGVADLHRVTEIAQAANQRYLSFLAKVDCPRELGAVLEPLCRRVCRGGRGYRGLRPLASQDDQLLMAAGRGEWVLSGFTNRQLRQVLHGAEARDPRENRRAAGRMSRQLALLRAHGIVKRMGTSRRWMLTDKGREVVTLLVAAKHASAKDLLRKAA